MHVIELKKAVLDHRKFVEANPGYDPTDSQNKCFYVGMTSLTPDERFENHKIAYKANEYVKRYGKYLRRRLYQRYNPMTRDEAEQKEVELAQELCAKGHAV